VSELVDRDSHVTSTSCRASAAPPTPEISLTLWHLRFVEPDGLHAVLCREFIDLVVGAVAS
jgi:hypothetical protein